MATSDLFRSRCLVSCEISNLHTKSETFFFKLFCLSNSMNWKMKPNNSTCFVSCMISSIHTILLVEIIRTQTVTLFIFRKVDDQRQFNLFSVFPIKQVRLITIKTFIWAREQKAKSQLATECAYLALVWCKISRS